MVAFTKEVEDIVCAPASIDHLKSQKRRDRNELLKETDWTQMPDVPDSTKTKWASHRQELRDLPNKSGFPDVDMPTQPS